MVVVENVAADERERLKKRKVRRAIVAFIVMMGLLTLFSNTLLHVSLPQVTTGQTDAGALVHLIIGSGTIEAADPVELRTDTGWPVAAVKVKRGDRVKAGQLLVSFRTDDARSSLLDEQARYEQKQISIEKLMDDYKEAVRNGNDHQAGAISHDLQSARLDLQVQERKIQRLQKQLETGTSLASPVDGIVMQVTAAVGVPVTAASPVVTIADQSKGQKLKANVNPNLAKFAAVGDETDLIFSSLGNARMKAKLTEMNDVHAASGDIKEMVFTLTDERLQGGESGEFVMTKRMAASKQILANPAVREDSQGTFVLVLKLRRGPLGNEFYVQKVSVVTGDTDDTMTVIESGLNPGDKVVLSANKPVADGDRVVLANG